MIKLGIGIGKKRRRGTASWTPDNIVDKLLFWGKVTDIAAGEMPNLVTGSTDYLTVAGSPATYQTPNTAPYQNADTDKIWFKTDVSQRTVTTVELIGYDFARTLVKYSSINPYPLGKQGVYNGRSEVTHEDYGIGLFNSLDGITWNRDLVLGQILAKGLPGSWEEKSVFGPQILLVNGVLYLYYVGYDNSDINQIGLATSDDYGQTWVKYIGNPIITKGGVGTWDGVDVFGCRVIYDDVESVVSKKWKMWYSGYDGSSFKVGLAYSSDGITWIKYGSNPVFEGTGTGTWDNGNVGFTCIVKRGDTYNVFYSGTGNDSITKAGLLTFTDPEGTYTKHAGNPIFAPPYICYSKFNF